MLPPQSTKILENLGRKSKERPEQICSKPSKRYSAPMDELAHEILDLLVKTKSVTTKMEFQRLANNVYRVHKTRETLPAHTLVYAYQD